MRDEAEKKCAPPRKHKRDCGVYEAPLTELVVGIVDGEARHRAGRHHERVGAVGLSTRHTDTHSE